VLEDTADALDPRRAATARALARGSLWVEPVDDIASDVRALVTVFVRDSGRPATGHAYGMSVAKRFVELILRWRHQIGRLEDAAYRDPLTGLANRQVFFDALEQERRGGAVLYCDLDRFKPVNDALGHLAGDALLRQVAERLRSHVRSDDLVARLGGDEFAVLLRGASPDQATELTERLTNALDVPFELSGEQVSVGISIGMAHTDGHLGEETLDQADRALYASKASRR
jgi:diguanylate cyclase (GGDEF)-like protein